MGSATAEIGTGRRLDSSARNVRRDIADMIRLIRFVEECRALMAVGQSEGTLAPCDDLLATLRLELKAILPLRHFGCGRPAGLLASNDGAAWRGFGHVISCWPSGQAEREGAYVAS